MIKILVDTNILVSAALFPGSVPDRAYAKAVTPPYKAVACDYSMDELRRVFDTKFPRRLREYERFVSLMALSVEVIPTPADDGRQEDENKIRDIKDRPILRAAIAAKADILITGDKDFLDSRVEHPQIMTAANFLTTA
jgi:putative PIN family toxin of toxin-antitoxin system